MALAAIAALSGGLVAGGVPSCISTPSMRGKSSTAHLAAGGLCLSERPVWFRSMAACRCPTVDPSHPLYVVVHPCRPRSGFPGSVGERVSGQRRLRLSFPGFSSGPCPSPIGAAGDGGLFLPVAQGAGLLRPIPARWMYSLRGSCRPWRLGFRCVIPGTRDDGLLGRVIHAADGLGLSLPQGRIPPVFVRMRPGRPPAEAPLDLTSVQCRLGSGMNPSPAEALSSQGVTGPGPLH